MRVFVCILAVLAMLASGIGNAMHVHLDAGDATSITHDAHSPGDPGKSSKGHALSCHSCAHASPSATSAGNAASVVLIEDSPHVDSSRLKAGGAWPPLAEPPR